MVSILLISNVCACMCVCNRLMNISSNIIKCSQCQIVPLTSSFMYNGLHDLQNNDNILWGYFPFFLFKRNKILYYKYGCRKGKDKRICPLNLCQLIRLLPYFSSLFFTSIHFFNVCCELCKLVRNKWHKENLFMCWHFVFAMFTREIIHFREPGKQ